MAAGILLMQQTLRRRREQMARESQPQATLKGHPLNGRFFMVMADGTERRLEGFIVQKSESALDAMNRTAIAAGAVGVRFEGKS